MALPFGEGKRCRWRPVYQIAYLSQEIPGGHREA